MRFFFTFHFLFKSSVQMNPKMKSGEQTDITNCTIYILNHIITRYGNQATNHIRFILTWQGLFNLPSEQKSVSQKLTRKVFFPFPLSLGLHLAVSLPLSVYSFYHSLCFCFLSITLPWPASLSFSLCIFNFSRILL